MRQQFQAKYVPGPAAPNVGRMLNSSIAAGAMFMLWRNAVYEKTPLRKWGMLAGGGALISVMQEVCRKAILTR